jgi:putative ABC transport system permease protein
MVAALDRKLFRELSNLRGQVITIALVVACGISSYVAMRTAYDSLFRARDEYYEKYRFADVFATLKRAPRALTRHLESIPGVAEVQTRIVERALVPMESMARPASGTILSVPPHAAGQLNSLYIKEGRGLDSKQQDEVLVIEGFAHAHGLRPGSALGAVINGTLRNLRVVGVALSPEFVMTLAPGQLTYDPALSPVLWMNQAALEAAFQLEGAFNSATLRLARDASPVAVQVELDSLLKPYGGFGSVARDKQQSNYMLNGELTQLDSMAGFVPYLFLAVAALLVNVVLSRLVQLQRSTIATLKAVGYSNRSITFHYLKLVSVIVGLGAVLGVLVGAWIGKEMMDMYTGQYQGDPKERRCSASRRPTARGR